MTSIQIARRRLKALIAVAVGMGTALAACAQSFPAQPIRLVVGFAPGTGSDMVARLVAKPLGDRLGQNVVVENKVGAGGLIAADAVAKSTPDGYTLFFVSSAHGATAATKKTLPFDPVNAFTWISTVTTYPFVLIVKPDSPIKSFADYLQRTKAEPDKYFYSSPGVGSAVHLVGEWIMAENGSKAIHVPFQGGAAPLTELLSGRVDVMLDTLVGSAPLLKAARVRALAVTGPKGSSSLPGIPTVADTYPNLAFESWLGVAAPVGTPPAVITRLNNELQTVMGMPNIRQRLVDWGANPQASSSADFKTRVERDILGLKRVVAERQIQMD